jgi:lipid A disaccharide synthetase
VSNTGNWNFRVVYTDTEEDKFGAMAGSDMSICYNGDIATECLVYRTPTIVMQNLNHLESHHMLSRDRFVNEMNLIAEMAVVPEMLDHNHLVDAITHWIDDPEERMQYH